MPYILIKVSYSPETAAKLHAELGVGWKSPRRLFDTEALHKSSRQLPVVGDLVSDSALPGGRIFRLEQRRALLDKDANVILSYRATEHPHAGISLQEPEPVQLMADAKAALFSEFMGGQQPVPQSLLATPLRAIPNLRAGDVVQDPLVSRHMYLIHERIFFWTERGDVEVRYLLNFAMPEKEWEQFRV